MHNIPDVVGMELQTALDILNKNSIKYSIFETLSPKVKSKDGECRVIHLRAQQDNIEILVSYF